MNQYGFIVEVDWLINGSIGASNTSSERRGTDTIICACEESDIENCVETFIEDAGQGRGEYSIINSEVIENSYFSFAYWTYTNVSDFKYTNFRIIERFTKEQYEKNELKEYIIKAIAREYYYWN